MDEAEAQMLRQAIRTQDQYIGEQNTKLRELLAHCRAQNAKPFDRASAVRAKAYRDVASRLEAILDMVAETAVEVDPDTGQDR